MTEQRDANKRMPSTRWDWRLVKIEQPARAHRNSRPEGVRTTLPTAKAMREKITITVKYRGGAECWWECHARGRRFRFPGHMAIHDVMRVIYRDVGFGDDD